MDNGDDGDAENVMLLFKHWKESRNRHQICVTQQVLGTAQMAHMCGVLMDQAMSRRWGGRFRGSRTCRRGLSSWASDYLGDLPVFTPRQFRQRFRVPRALFYRIRDDLVRFRPEIWDMRTDCCGRRGQTADVKVLACLRYIGQGRSLDDLDDSCRMSKETVRRYVRHFYNDVLALYGDHFLNRYPCRLELQSIAETYEASGFPGCIGAVDCTDILWKNCPLEEKGQFHNPKDSKLAVIKAEGWCDTHLYMWNWFVGRPGTTNDKTMMRFSPLFVDIFNRTYDINLPVPYKITRSGPQRTLAYFLGDGIYPHYPIFVLPVHGAEQRREVIYTKRQEGRRKDIERAFGVIKARFRILRKEDFRWYRSEIITCSHVCVVLHNMIVRMNQEGHFVEDVAAEGADFDMIDEMLQHEEEESARRRQEKEATENEVDEHLSALAPVDLRDELYLQELEFTSPEMHEALKEELMDRFAAERGDVAQN